MAFNIQQLEAFTAVVRHGSLGRAAAVLNVTQPALSRMVKRLEDDVGSPLFERHSKGMKLTDIGEALLPHANLVNRESRQAREDIDALRGLAKGTIRVGAVASIACFVLPMAIGGVLSAWPGLRIEVLEGVWDRLSEALTSYEIDVALGVDALDTDQIVAIRDCQWEDVSYVVASANHPLRGRSELRLEETCAEKWASLPRGTAPHAHLEQVFAEHGIGPPNIVVETRSITVLKSLVTDSGFLSWMAAPMYLAERRAGLVDALPITGVKAMRRLTAFRRRQGILPGPAVKLIEELRSMAKAKPRISALR
ncbi:LysR family transcriptional regulator [Bradyrhizobium sp. S69]|uniref:LysR family transcriptional regulator n=1 Tax=Bradyrhizobium sp. S69 TaxID=1641856 RepID=UPI00131AA8E8|nr:LysR family transcriptional regulator [Bradyrhizobium sp. S69]